MKKPVVYYDGQYAIKISIDIVLNDFLYIWNRFGSHFINFKNTAMSHEKAKEQTKNKKEPTKNLKEKRAAKKAKKEEKKRQ
jgi:hypothetical protein